MPVIEENVRADIAAAYSDVRDDGTETRWALLAYEGDKITLGATGSDYEDFKSRFTDDERSFGFVRFITGDEMSKRAKFALITWCGSNVAPLKRARLSTDKTEVKRVITSISIELQTSDPDELEEEYVRKEIIKAGGANYGTGVRD